MLHEQRPPSIPRRTVQEMVVDSPALALGSSQSEADVDARVAEEQGISVVRRRSGGGAVLLVPGAHVWLDVWLPAGDPLWIDDVRRAADWLADVWIAALGALGVGALNAHRGPLETNGWSSHICFAGLGAGEVTAAGDKLVGVSQRRTREWARFQCLVHRRWDAEATLGLLAIAGSAPEHAVWSARVAEIGPAPVTAAFDAALARLT
jgi:lipoate-protein ligase A